MICKICGEVSVEEVCLPCQVDLACFLCFHYPCICRRQDYCKGCGKPVADIPELTGQYDCPTGGYCERK